MAAKLEELTLVFSCERQRWGETVLAEAKTTDEAPKTITIKGAADPDELQPQLSYRFYGHWTTHEKYGRQFVFKTFVRCQPHGKSGTVRYLCQAPGVGQAISAALWNKFGGDAVRILRETPDVAAAAVQGLTIERAEKAAEWLAGELKLEDCSIDLMDLLGGSGMPKTTAKKAVARWGNKAPEMIRRNPYLLMNFRGCGFARCDAMYLHQGHPPARLKRQAYSVWYALACDTDGHAWRPLGFAIAGIRARIAGAQVAEAAAIELARRGGLVKLCQDDQGRTWIAEAKRARAEEDIVRYIGEAIEETAWDSLGLPTDNQWPDPFSVNGIDGEQPEKLALATAGRIGVFGGSPGTGKTYTVACMVRRIVALYGEQSVAVAAPTGKAAVRVTEAMQGYGLKIKATTIHSLLKVAQRDEGEGWGFEHDEGNPLPVKFVIIDEASMIDASLMASLLSARGTGTHLLFVGDVNQLPPVGHGAPLRDFIAAGLPYGELREIRRNSGTIVRACAQIRDGRPFGTDREIDLESTPARNLHLVSAGGIDSSIGEMLAWVGKASKMLAVDPVWGVQILVPLNAKSKLSRKDLNAVLQRELNKTGRKVGSNPFLVGDKIVCLKNSFVPIDEQRHPRGGPRNADNKVFVANGELAEVIDVAEKITTAKLTSPDRVVKIPRGKGATSEGDGENPPDDKADTGCSWDLGYALSCHKSQGSEWPAVLVMIDDYPGARMVCSREWVYTAISRAKKLCLLIGKRATADGFCKRQAITNRKTFLAERIREKAKEVERAETELVAIQ